MSSKRETIRDAFAALMATVTGFNSTTVYTERDTSIPEDSDFPCMDVSLGTEVPAENGGCLGYYEWELPLKVTVIAALADIETHVKNIRDKVGAAGSVSGAESVYEDIGPDKEASFDISTGRAASVMTFKALYESPVGTA